MVYYTWFLGSVRNRVGKLEFTYDEKHKKTFLKGAWCLTN